MTLRRFLAPCVAYGAIVLAAAACKDQSVSSCFESGATAYRVALGGDTTKTFRWPASSMPVRFYAEPVGTLPANVDSALALWLNAMRCGELSVQRVADSNVADVIIRNPAQMPPTSLRASLHADSTNACLGRTDPFFDQNLTELLPPIRTYVAPQGVDSAATESCYHFVVAHEVGHTLGIFAHSPVAGDLMYSVPTRRVLTGNDKYTIQLLYHLPAVGIGVGPRQ